MEMGLWMFLAISSTAWAAVAIYKIKYDKCKKDEKNNDCNCNCSKSE